MNNKDTTEFFKNKDASSYDEKRAKLAPIKDALHLCMQMILTNLPENAHILCVGAGTGAELISLAEVYPTWSFTVVEPSSDMIKRCKEQVERVGITSRCNFHEGYLDSLGSNTLYDAATSILVSHFIVDERERIQYFAEVSRSIKVGGYMINADLSADMSGVNYNKLLDVWINMHEYAGMPANIDAFGNKVSLLSAEKIEDILVCGDFENPVLFYQALFIRAWFSKKS